MEGVVEADLENDPFNIKVRNISFRKKKKDKKKRDENHAVEETSDESHGQADNRLITEPQRPINFLEDCDVYRRQVCTDHPPDESREKTDVIDIDADDGNPLSWAVTLKPRDSNDNLHRLDEITVLEEKHSFDNGEIIENGSSAPRRNLSRLNDKQRSSVYKNRTRSVSSYQNQKDAYKQKYRDQRSKSWSSTSFNHSLAENCDNEEKTDPNRNEATNGIKLRSEDFSKSRLESEKEAAVKRRSMGPLKMAAMNGLTISRATMMFAQNDETRAPKDDRRKTLEIKLEEGQVYTEFEKIPKKVTTAECRVSHLTDNVDKNRFKDVLPYDSSRVRLKPRGNNASGYINASHIRVRVKGQDMWYVAAQAPLQDTCEDFWQMVWDQDIHIIAMLTQLKELGKEKSYPYWPQAPGSKNRLRFGDYQVTLQFHADSLCFATYGIHLKNKVSREERLIWHLQYTDWPDHGCPDDVHGFLAFLEEVESVNRHMAIENPEIKKHPILVHCSAGVGRSGVAILVQVMKSCLEFNQSVDVPTVLATLRGQRMHMVQTVAQYSFVYKTLIEYLKNTRLI